MNTNAQRLHNVIDDFLTDVINAELFEKLFSQIYDFEEIETNEQAKEYFALVSEILERFSFSKNDLQMYPEYYIDSNQLKDQVCKYKKEYMKETS